MKKIAAFYLILALGVIYSCAVNPVTGKSEISFMSEEQEVALGKQSDPAIQAQYGVYNDPQIQKFITEKGLEMAKISHRPGLDYYFKVVDSDVVNAFALPGGYVYFTRGIMAHFNNEAEFAGVLGHEIGHITARHGARQQTSQTLGQIGLMGGMILSPQLRSMANEASQSLQLLFLSFSRSHESESDKLGVEYSSKIGYDAHYMANFFHTLKRISDAAGHRLPTFQSTHPDPADRFQNVNAMASEYQRQYPSGSYKVNRDQYLRMIDGIIYGPDPQQGYVDNDEFIHPGLKFKFNQPTDFQLINTPTAVNMVSKKQDALLTFTLGSGNSLEEVAKQIAEGQKLTVKGSQKTTINNLPALAMESTVQDQSGNVLTVLNYVIHYGDYFYVFQGVCAEANYNTYGPVFQRTSQSFGPENRTSKLNVKPEVVSIKKVGRTTSLQNFFSSVGVKNERMNELAILNSMNLDDQISAGTLVKVIEKQK